PANEEGRTRAGPWPAETRKPRTRRGFFVPSSPRRPRGEARRRFAGADPPRAWYGRRAECPVPLAQGGSTPQSIVMLRSFRESLFGQIALGAIVLAIIVAFALTGSGAGGAASLVTDCAVKVKRHCIGPKEFQAAYGLYTSVGLSDQAVKRLNLRRQVARGLVERELLVDHAKEL